jgi:hypothetical protein
VTSQSDSDIERKFDNLMIFIESAIESEQPNGPAPFSLETELRLNLVRVNLREMLGLPAE